MLFLEGPFDGEVLCTQSLQLFHWIAMALMDFDSISSGHMGEDRSICIL